MLARKILTGVAIYLTPALLSAANGRAVISATSTGVPVAGTVKLSDTPKGLHVVVNMSAAPAGQHALHIHEFGSCDDSGKAAGSHYNPEGHPHGNVLKDGFAHAHPGDLGNITINADGTGTLDAVLPKVTLAEGKYTVGGRAFILHEKVDDFSQPVGNAGGRIGCGPIILTKD